MQTIKANPQHTFQILTKRTQRMLYFFDKFIELEGVPSNLWVGTTVEDKECTNRIDSLKKITAPVRFLSCEPLLSDLGTLDLSGIDWVIVGGESGNKARPMQKQWVLNIQKQCKQQDVPFFFKQWGTWGEDGVKRDKKANGNTIDGVVYQEFPNVSY